MLLNINTVTKTTRIIRNLFNDKQKMDFPPKAGIYKISHEECLSNIQQQKFLKFKEKKKKDEYCRDLEINSFSV